MMGLIDVYGSILQSHGHKITNQRKTVLLVMLENMDCYLTVEEILEKIIHSNQSFSLATIYRAVTTLNKIGILDKLVFDGVSRYRLITEIPVVKDTRAKRNYRTICRDCNKIQDISLPDLDKAVIKQIEKLDINIDEVDIKFFGTCDDCEGRKENF